MHRLKISKFNFSKLKFNTKLLLSFLGLVGIVTFTSCSSVTTSPASSTEPAGIMITSPSILGTSIILGETGGTLTIAGHCGLLAEPTLTLVDTHHHPIVNDEDYRIVANFPSYYDRARKNIKGDDRSQLQSISQPLPNIVTIDPIKIKDYRGVTVFDVPIDIKFSSCTASSLVTDTQTGVNEATAIVIDNVVKLALLAELINNKTPLDETANPLRFYNNLYYKVTENIDFNQAPSATTDFIPIGSTLETIHSNLHFQTNAFSGTFDCRGNFISNLAISNTNNSSNIDGHYLGLFGVLITGTIKNCGLINTKITGLRNIGSFAGSAINSTIEKSFSYRASIVGTENIGGLVGSFSRGDIQKSFAHGEVITGNQNIGGLIGENFQATVSQSYTTGNIIGGLRSTRLGGLVGQNNDALIVNSYSTSTISGFTVIGGLVGFNFNGFIRNSYALGLITGITNTGGLIGSGNNSLDITSQSYWNIETTQQATSFGAGYGYTSDQLTLINDNYRDILDAGNPIPYTYEGWNTAVWALIKGLYPTLNDVACPNEQPIDAIIPICENP
ncbi:hypothetical protein COTS27_00240 [Spirochaetota bacterium]|nr:hypothetical protein COTS27_00240 [Spirochaetota bacterium]